MLRSIKDLIGYPLHATDGDFGKVTDCLIDDKEWGLRYLVADTGGWLKRHEVIVSPRSLDQPEVGWFDRHLPVKLTKEELEKSPPLESKKPISQLYEEEFARYFKHEMYWEGSFIWGAALSPSYRAQPPASVEALHEERLKWIADRCLRSAKEVMGYAVEASDGEIGHVDDLILQTDQWRVRYLVIDTRNWLPGKKVLADVDWVEDIDWSSEKVAVNQTRDKIRHSPTYHAHDAVNRKYEEEFYDYYGEPRYWEELPPIM